LIVNVYTCDSSFWKLKILVTCWALKFFIFVQMITLHHCCFDVHLLRCMYVSAMGLFSYVPHCYNIIIVHSSLRRNNWNWRLLALSSYSVKWTRFSNIISLFGRDLIQMQSLAVLLSDFKPCWLVSGHGMLWGVA